MAREYSPAAAFIILLILGILQPGAEAMKNSYQKAAFAGGCFWGMEKAFGALEGVVSTRV